MCLFVLCLCSFVNYWTAFGAVTERLAKLIDYYEGSFQDYIGHDDSVSIVRFSYDGSRLVTVSHNQMLVWSVEL
jgi:hypothetical protein